MALMNQDELGRCDFLDVLEEASTLKRPVAVQLRSGKTFIDVVQDVVTEGGEDFAVFTEHGRIAVSDVDGVSRSEPVKGVYPA